MRLLPLSIILLVLGILFLLLTPLSHPIKVDNVIEIPPNSSYVVGYNGNSEVLFSYNSTFPINVTGYPSGATKSNDSIIYVICFFSSSPGNLYLSNHNPESTTVYYTLYEASGLSLYIEYFTVFGPILIVGGVILFIYARLTHKK